MPIDTHAAVRKLESGGFAKLKTRIEAASNRMLVALMAVAGLLFAALKLWP